MRVMESSGKKSSNLLAPGYRFHPTDEELVRYYLRRKVCGKIIQVEAVTEIDIYKVEPWDLPGLSKLKSRDLEWYFFSALDKKYVNGAKTNRATEKGYWKTTGKDRPVYHKKQIVGMKKTLVFHIGRPPKGQRSNWVMHEYRLVDLELERAGIYQDAFVVCRVFQKSGSGPKNGEQYGAPFVEEEWEIDDFESDMKKEASEEVNFEGDAYLDRPYLEQILGSDNSLETVLPLLNFPYAVGGHNGETTESFTDMQNFMSADYQCCRTEEFDETNCYGLPTLHDTNVNIAKHEFIGESSKSGNDEDVVYLSDEPFLDSFDYLPHGNEGFIETNDLSDSVGANTPDFNLFEEYLTYFDVNDTYIDADSTDFQALVSDSTSHPVKVEETGQSSTPSEQFTDNSRVVATSPSDGLITEKCQSDIKFPFIKRATEMLGNIPAPPAFAAEFPSKNASLHFGSASSSVHVTADMIQIQNLSVGTNGSASSSLKLGNLNITFSFGFSRSHDGSANLESSVSIHPGKTLSAISSDWFYFFLRWILILAMGFKIGTYVCAN